MTENTPYAGLMAIDRGTDVGGLPVATMTPGNMSFAREGVMHGGAVAALLDYAARFAVGDALEKGNRGDAALSVVSMTVDYLRPGLMVPSTARGQIVKLGARVASVNVLAWGADESKPFAAAKLTIGIGEPA